MAKEQAQQNGCQDGGMQRVGQVVIVEDIDPEGHEEDRGKDDRGGLPGPQQRSHQGEQRDQADDTQQQEAGIDAEAGNAAQPAGNGRTQNAGGKRCGHGAPLAQRQQPILPGIGRVDGARQTEQDGKAQAPGREKQGEFAVRQGIARGRPHTSGAEAPYATTG